MNECIDQGRIDDALHYMPPDSSHEKVWVNHLLVLTDKYRELDADGTSEKQERGMYAWRIQNAEPVVWLTVDTAIWYVTKTRESASDPLIKKNADQTLARLKTLQ